MVKLLEKSYKNGCCKRVEQWAIDTDAELANLPTVPAGSCAISSESGITFYANTSGEWPKDPSKYESGGGGNSTYNVEYIVGEEIMSAWNNKNNITSINFPNLKSIGGYAFNSCTSLKEADFPNVTSIGEYAFNSCDSLTTADFPNATSIGNNAFTGCTSLKEADFPNVTSIGEYAFYGCDLLTTLIVRTSEICNIDVSSILKTKIVTEQGVPVGEGFIYVPSALVPSYITDFIPKIIALGQAFGMPMDEPTVTYIATAIFRPLEDYTVDGTVTGELDESKI